MKTLYLTLKKKWFDMEMSGEKPEEYRAITPYWVRRLMTDDMNFKSFDNVFARNGYNPKLNPSFERKCLGISTGYGNPEWGAEPGVKCFIIKLGEKL